jgi:hypothetical protein
MHLICRDCSTRLSNELQPVSLAQRNEAMGEDFLRCGTVMQEDGTYFQGRAGSYIVHPDDIVHARLTTDFRRRNGCCGLDGVDGPNLQCETCGVYVATKMTDCWMPHCVIFESTATQAQEDAIR